MSKINLQKQEKGMYGTLALTPRSVKDYAPFAGKDRIDELMALAAPLRGLRVLNLSVTAFGTGLAELLRASVPLFCDLGLDCRWQIVRADEEATQVNKLMYRALAGGRVEWTQAKTEAWRSYTAMNAGLLNEEFDIIIVHDLQPVAIRSYVESSPAGRARWVLHCHTDLSAAQPDVWALLEDHLRQYDCWVMEDELFEGNARFSAPVNVIAPAVDPLGPRNMELSEGAIADILQRYGVDVGRPLISQVAPISEDSDALGALEVYRMLRERVPELQMVMLASSPPDGAEPYAYFERVVGRASELPDVHILSNLDDVGNVEINVVQRASAVMMQRALQRGFGIWLSDALWKETPVVGAPMGGIPKQVIDGRTGYLAESDAEFADCLFTLLTDREKARELGAAGRQHVAENFLVCRFLADYLRLLGDMN
jgi:trehalose synthase